MSKIDQKELAAIFKEVSARLLSKAEDRGFLIFRWRKSDRIQREWIQEPDAKQILSTILSEKSIYFGLEWPTLEVYDFSGPNRGTARIDVAIEPRYKGIEQINVELKEGWSASKTGSKSVGRIQKDFEKMLREPVSGCAFYHILQGPTRKDLSKLLGKYLIEYEMAVTRVRERDKIISKWCLLFFFLRENQECYWREFDDISRISLKEPDLNGFNHMSLSE